MEKTNASLESENGYLAQRLKFLQKCATQSDQDLMAECDRLGVAIDPQNFSRARAIAELEALTLRSPKEAAAPAAQPADDRSTSLKARTARGNKFPRGCALSLSIQVKWVHIGLFTKPRFWHFRMGTMRV